MKIAKNWQVVYFTKKISLGQVLFVSWVVLGPLSWLNAVGLVLGLLLFWVFLVGGGGLLQ